jgi:hypothetical protein
VARSGSIYARPLSNNKPIGKEYDETMTLQRHILETESCKDLYSMCILCADIEGANGGQERTWNFPQRTFRIERGTRTCTSSRLDLGGRKKRCRWTRDKYSCGKVFILDP